MIFIRLEVYERLLPFDLSLDSSTCTFLLQGDIVSTAQLVLEETVVPPPEGTTSRRNTIHLPSNIKSDVSIEFVREGIHVSFFCPPFLQSLIWSKTNIAVIFHGDDYDDYDLVGCDVLWLCAEIPTFGMGLAPPSSGWDGYREEGGRGFLRNLGSSLPKSMAPRPRRP
jgi:hypothetical protein